MKKEISIPCIYNGKSSKITFIQGKIDIQFIVGKKVKYDHITSINVYENIVSFNGLYFGSILNKIEININELYPIFENFKVRVLSKCKKYGTMYKDRDLTNLKVASKGESIFDKVINKRGNNAMKFLKNI